MELNRFVLDGSFDTVENYKVPFWSSEKSDENCVFAVHPSFDVKFDEAHTSVGLTFNFIEDYPTEMIISWYYDSNQTTKILSKTFYPDSMYFFCFEQVEYYKSIKVEFVRTRQPKQYVNVAFTTYGKVQTWANEDVITATVNEEIDVTSATIPINTAEMTFLDAKNDYNVQNPNGLWKSLQTSQRVVVTENVDGSEIAVGTFYIDNWTSKENSISLNLVDAVGIIDKSMFDGGMYSNVRVENLVADIMASANITDYTLADDLKDLTLSGYLPICTHREALQQIAFATGAVVDCSRTSAIKIYVPDRNVDSFILVDRKFSGQTVSELTDYVSSISITCQKYTPSDEVAEIFNGHLDKGTHKIEFGEPYTSLNCTGGTITAQGVNYAVISMSADGDAVLTGKGYETSEFTTIKSADRIEVGQKPSTKSFSGLTLYNMQILPSVAENLLKWYSLRQTLSIEYICKTEEVGEWVGVQDNIDKNKYAITRINSQSIDLTGGYLATAECRGYSTIVSVYAYMGNGELRMSGEELI